jgi:hypothetical protein
MQKQINAIIFFGDNTIKKITLKENTAEEYKKIIVFYETKNKNITGIITQNLLQGETKKW